MQPAQQNSYPQSPLFQTQSIRNIVQLVQSGKLNTLTPNRTTEPEHVPAPAPVKESPEVVGMDHDDDSSHSSSKLTSESRWLLIKQLAQRKALKSQDPNYGSSGQSVGSIEGPVYSGPDVSGGGGANDYHSTADTDSHLRYGRPTPMSPTQRQQQQQQQQQYYSQQQQGYGNDFSKPSMNNWVSERPRQSPTSPMQRRQQQQQQADPRGSFDNSFGSSSLSPRRQLEDGDDARAFRQEQNVTALENEVYKECTFQPRFFTSDTSRNRSRDSETPFYDRVQRWQNRRSEELDNKRKAKERAEVESCSFQPKLNRNSLRAAEELRGGGGGIDGGGTSPEGNAEDVAARLHRVHEESLQLKAKYIDMEMKRVADQEMRSCTFKPNISSTANSKYGEVQPKYHLEPQPPQPRVDPREKENTFTPKVKGVTASMASAKAYLQTNVVDRLSKPLSQSMDDSIVRRPGSTPFDASFGGNVMDMNAYLGGGAGAGAGAGAGVSSSASVGSANSRQRQRLSVGGGGNNSNNSQPSRAQTPMRSIFRSSFSHEVPTRASSAPRERSGSTTPRMSAEERQERKKKFEEFMHRQLASETKKRVHTEQVLQWATPQFKPTLDKKSLQIAQDNDQSEFLDRMEKFLLRKNDASEKRQSQSALRDQGCTFAPILTKRVDGMRARSVQELSRGDQLRKEQKIRTLSQRREQETRESLTFKPELTAKGKEKASILHIAEMELNPNAPGPVQYAARKNERRDKAAAEAKRAREEQEEKACTFAPTTKKCPAFIVRIADGMKMIHKAKSAAAAVAASNNTSLAASFDADASMASGRKGGGSVRGPSPVKPAWRHT